MTETASIAPRGRQAQAARNDQVILDAARTVFIADPASPISAVANLAGVGIAALYRRYASKEDLLRRLCADGLRLYIRETEAALADSGDPWSVFATWMARIVDADTNSLVQRLAGTFTPTDEMYRDSVRAEKLNKRLLARTKAAGAIRGDVDVNDIALIFEMIAAVRVTDPVRTAALRHRYLALLLDAMHNLSATPLPSPPPTSQELGQRWQK
jgi:AcrR family transcriptional regulator